VSGWWVDRSLRTKGLLVLAAPLAMLLTAAAVFFFSTAQADSAQRSVNHTRAVEADLAAAQTLVVDGETGIRAFLATGDEVFLEPAGRARARLGDTLDRLEQLTAEDPAQAARLDRVRQEVARGLQTDAPQGVAPGSGAQQLRAWFLEQKASTDAIRSVLAEMRTAQEQRLAAAMDDRDAWRARNRVGTGLALAVGVAAGLIGVLAFTLGITRRLRRLELGSQEVRAGQPFAAVDPGADEIGVLSRRMAEITNRWLLWQREATTAREDAEAASRAKNDFLSRMSHELRTPLNAVLGFAQLLEMDLPDDQREPVAQIRRAGRHLLTLINEVLDIAKIEAGQLTLSPETVKVSDLIEEAAELMAPIADAHTVTLRTEPPDTCVCHVLADRQRAKQVLLNLMSNAVKYNRPGGTVRVRCRPAQAGAAIEVEDTGLGISEHDLKRLFVPFERLAAAGSDIEGTGVGLALAQRLAATMDGRIDVRSRVGQGSTFTFTLPAAAEPAAAAIPVQPGPDRPQPTATAAAAVPAACAHTVLSIEDNLANTRLFEQIIARRPTWRLVTAAQAQLGLDLAAADPPQLILLDLHLPDLPGLQVLRRLKAAPATADIPVVIVSADATPGLIQRLRASGASAYLTKPIDVAEILQLLDDIAAAPTQTQEPQ
jgi:signal transduction histidine kinase/ActR/RegA family two-component response regulator